jgi:hypothetical protein
LYQKPFQDAHQGCLTFRPKVFDPEMVFDDCALMTRTGPWCRFFLHSKPSSAHIVHVCVLDHHREHVGVGVVVVIVVVVIIIVVVIVILRVGD